MKHTSAAALEFEALKRLLSGYVSTSLGQAELERVAPSADAAFLAAAHAECAEGVRYLRSNAPRVHFAAAPGIARVAERLRIEGAGLEAVEIFDLLSLLELATEARATLSAPEGFPMLSARSRSIADFRPLLAALQDKILPGGAVADHASAALARIRREIEHRRKAIHAALDRFLKTHQEEGVIQEEFVAIRNDRFVVPVIAGQRRKLDGVIHGASSSGQTLFVEPLETIEMNNDLVRLAEEELREIDRILREMTAKLRAYAPAISAAIEAMGALEWIFAKARFAAAYDCATPVFSPSSAPRLIFRNARHPLLQDVLGRQGKRVTPVTVELDSDRRTLLISGPNTGGKTVALKTVGLLTLMAQAGLPIPCSEAELPVFDRVLADIGDNQSIQESLSTFSAHISNIRDMLADVTSGSLVLLDELGAATDPEEGGALGVAVIDCFRAAGAFTLASTHLVALKIYGANTPSVENASMGFDETTLEPTYRLLTGLPGKSAGLDIAARLGMPPAIVGRARAALSDRDRDMTRLIAELHRRLDELSSLEKSLREQKAAAEALAREQAEEAVRSQAARMKDLDRRAEDAIRRFEAQAAEAIARSSAPAKAERAISKTVREFREQYESAIRPLDVPKAKALEVAEGARVRVTGVREPARVRRLLPDGQIEVEAGFLRMRLSAEDVLEVLPDSGAADALPKNVSFRPAPQLNPLTREINLIGERAEEACDRVEKFLDDAVMATASRVRIVHGHGMGILKKAVHNLLARSPHVAKFYAAAQSEGGAGATIVELKE
jgi:DNA mismatch repair protein MutS2